MRWKHNFGQAERKLKLGEKGGMKMRDEGGKVYGEWVEFLVGKDEKEEIEEETWETRTSYSA